VGGGILCTYGPPAIISRNTISGNSDDGYGAGIWCYSSSPLISNCVLWDNLPREIYGGSPIVTYSNIKGGFAGEGNIDADPMFVLPDKQDYRLLWKSPCIDTGHPDSLDADGTRSDIGVYFFDQDDYLTIYLTPDTTAVAQGGQSRVTYTAINRWSWPQTFWVLSQATLPNGASEFILGPDRYILPAIHTEQVYILHYIQPNASPGVYEYKSVLALPPSLIFDEDWFQFIVVE